VGVPRALFGDTVFDFRAAACRFELSGGRTGGTVFNRAVNFISGGEFSARLFPQTSARAFDFIISGGNHVYHFLARAYRGRLCLADIAFDAWRDFSHSGASAEFTAFQNLSELPTIKEKGEE